MNKIWWKAAGIRALKTMAQTAAATIGTSAVISSVDWRMVISSAVLSGVLSLLTSVAGLPEVEMLKRVCDFFGTIIGIFFIWNFVTDIYDTDMERKDD